MNPQKEYIQKKETLKNEGGFTIMETLVAIFILLISITGPMVFSQNGLRAAFQSRDQVTAFYLAQDAIEYIKNRRDHNVLNPGTLETGNAWLSGIVTDCNGNNGCTVDTTTAEGLIQTCSTPPQYPGCLGVSDDGSDDNGLNYDSVNGFFTTSETGTESLYARNVYLRHLPTTDEIEILVKVRWTSHDTIGVREIVVVEYIQNWAQFLGL